MVRLNRDMVDNGSWEKNTIVSMYIEQGCQKFQFKLLLKGQLLDSNLYYSLAYNLGN